MPINSQRPAGVRANTAYGLQRRGHERGVELYFAATDAAFGKGDPAALHPRFPGESESTGRWTIGGQVLAEAMVALVLADHWLRWRAIRE